MEMGATYLLMPGFEGIARELCFPKQHYESIVPEKSGINRFSASHDIDLFIWYILHNQHYVQRYETSPS